MPATIIKAALSVTCATLVPLLLATGIVAQRRSAPATPPTSITVNDRFVYVLRGERLFQFDATTLRLVNQTMLPAGDPPLPALELAEAEEPEEIEETEAIETEEPVLQDAEIADEFGAAVGRGGGAGGKFGGRGGGRARLEVKGGAKSAGAIRAGLEWLKSHQSEDGRWDADGFMQADRAGEPSDGPGLAHQDVGITGLALLAFLGDGSTLRSGPYKPQVAKGVRWLMNQQQDNGLIGSDRSHDFIYGHAIATLALVEAYGLSDIKMLRKYAQSAINYLEAHRNPYGVWRYQPRDNDNDTSVTGWCLMAYKSAQDFKLEVNEQAFVIARTWLDQITDPATGRAGYTRRGEPSSRNAGDHAERFPSDRGEAMTAVALLSRFFLGQRPSETPVMIKGADLIAAKKPEWNEDNGAIDHYYWYFGTYAMYQMGKKHWQDWAKTLQAAVVDRQRRDGNAAGSWDPVGAWGEVGGRVYSTALMVLTLEAYYRYTRVFVR